MRRTTAVLVAAAGVLSAALGCTPAARSTAADEAAIRAMASEYTGAINAGDRAKFLSFLADSIVIMPPAQPSLRGQQAAAAFAGPLFDQFTMNETITYDEVHVFGDWASGSFTYALSVTPKAGGSTATEVGKAVVWLRRTPAGQWQFTRWIWNQDSAPK